MEQAARNHAQLGPFLRRIRKAAGMSQAQLGELTSKRQATISNLETAEGGATLETLFGVLLALDLELVVRPRTKGSAQALGDLF